MWKNWIGGHRQYLIVGIGAVAVLAADAWRCRAALALASRGGGPMDVYDVVA